MRESDRKLIEAIKAYREKLEQMTPEEREKEEESRKAMMKDPRFSLMNDSLED